MPPPAASHWITLHALAMVIALLVYALAAHALPQRRHPSAAIAWVLFIILLPYAALPIYLLFGTRKLPHAHRTLRPVPIAGHLDWFARVTASLSQSDPAGYQALNLHANGAEGLGALLETIDGAGRSLDVCTFLLGRDAVGAAIIERLAQRARAGVRVRFLIDGVGHWIGGGTDLSPLRRAGVQVGFFVPSLAAPFKGHLNLRNHRKFVVADASLPGQRLWCGGRNLAAEYFEGQGHGGAWHDLTFDLRGPLVLQMAKLFECDWNFAIGPASQPAPPAADFRPPAESTGADGRTGQLIASGPDQADDTVHTLLVSAAFHARGRMLLASPYVVPDESLLLALCLAARRGVVVDILLPARSNHRIADFARHRSFRVLADAGVRIWLSPNMLHAKAAIVDDDLALAGSSNLDSRSLLLNYEFMIAFRHAVEVARFAAWFETERSSARRYVPNPPTLLRDIAEGLMLWVCFQI